MSEPADRPEEKFTYRDHEVTLSRVAGTVYVSIFSADGWECETTFIEGWADRWPTVRKTFKERIDNELAEDDPWGREAEKERDPEITTNPTQTEPEAESIEEIIPGTKSGLASVSVRGNQ